MESVFSAGLGGGSLIYANVFLEPPNEVFQEGRPGKLNRKSLQPYYKIARQLLGARPIPSWDDDTRRKMFVQSCFKNSPNMNHLLANSPIFAYFLATTTVIKIEKIR
jgi:cholesterol oxidase